MDVPPDEEADADRDKALACFKGSEFEQRFEIGNVLGRGGFSMVFIGFDRAKNTNVAVKIQCKKEEVLNEGIVQLKNEAQWLNYLHGGYHFGGFPNLHYFGEYDKDNNYILIMELLGQSLQQLFQSCNFQFSMKTILLVIDQIMIRTQVMHAAGIVHCDLKPANMVMGTGPSSHVVHFIDFGLATSFYDSLTDKNHVGKTKLKTIYGTPRFMSCYAHRGRGQSRRDDMESLAYIMLYFLTGGKLPWQVIGGNGKSKSRQIFEMKSVPAETLFAGKPPEFATYLNKIRELKFTQEPNYLEYRQMFWKLAESMDIEYDDLYDWKLTSGATEELDLD